MVVSYLGRGIAHELAGKPCQDAVNWCVSDHGDIVMALSDGAGTARRAKEAAQGIVETVTEFFCGMPLADFTLLSADQRRSLLLDSCRASLLRIRESAEETDIRQFSATFVFAVVSDTQLLVGNLGDGLAVVLEESGRLCLDFGPEAGLTGGNSTWFVISPDAEQHLRMQVLERSAERVDFLALTSDGIWELLCGRGDGDPVRTIRELRDYVRSGDLDGDDALADILNQMAELTDERMDDWSVVLWYAEGETAGSKWEPVCRSMLREENDKYGIPESAEL